MEPEQANLSFEELLGILRRRALWIVLGVVLVTGAAYAYSKHKPKMYTATAAVAFSNNPLSQQIFGVSPGSSSNVVAQQDSNLELVRLGDMAAKTANLLGHGLTEGKVSESVSAGVKGETDVVYVTASSRSPTLAAAIADTYTNQFVKEQQSSNRILLKSALRQVNKQLAAISPAQRFSSIAIDLQQRAHTLRFLSELGYNTAQLAGEARIPTSPSSPKTKRNTLLGAVLGLLFGLGFAFLLERLDRRIREPEDLQEIYRLPMLGIIPKSTAFSRSAALPPAEAEVFSLIRAHLRFFNVDRDVRTVVIASPAQGDGKTTIARHLAEAAARSGSRALLLEVDLRLPTLAQHLDIAPGPGLADVLIGAVAMRDATQSVDVQASPGEGTGGRKLAVLAAGAVLPPNPAELLESHAMGALLEQAKSAYDLVVIDTPPLTAVSDAFPLLTRVDGVVIVGWIGRSHRDAAERLQQVLSSSGAPLLGVIANGSNAPVASPYTGDGKPVVAAARASANAASGDPVPSAKA